LLEIIDIVGGFNIEKKSMHKLINNESLFNETPTLTSSISNLSYESLEKKSQKY